MYKLRSHEYWLSWLANARRVATYLRQVFTSRALAVFPSSISRTRHTKAARILPVYDSAVKGRSRMNEYFLNNDVVTRLYTAGPSLLSYARSLDRCWRRLD